MFQDSKARGGKTDTPMEFACSHRDGFDDTLMDLAGRHDSLRAASWCRFCFMVCLDFWQRRCCST